MDREHPTVPLSRAYVCVDGAPVIDRVDPRIFTLTYFSRCLDCTFCHDACCQYGADTEMVRVEALEPYTADLEQYLGLPADQWFRTDEDDFGVLDESDYPGGRYTRTQVSELPAGRSPQHPPAGGAGTLGNARSASGGICPLAICSWSTATRAIIRAISISWRTGP